VKTVALLDLGGTLVDYYTREEFPQVLDEALREVTNTLARRGLLTVPADDVRKAAAGERHEAPDYRVRPLEERLARIFRLPTAEGTGDLARETCAAFLKPIFTRARLRPETIPALRSLKKTGVRMAVVSNAPWGSPAEPWRTEVARHGIAEFAPTIVICRDAGWRKPARPVFDLALERMHARPEECVFVGDEPAWDIAGAAGAGIAPVLVDKTGKHADRTDCAVIASLSELPGLILAS